MTNEGRLSKSCTIAILVMLLSLNFVKTVDSQEDCVQGFPDLDSAPDDSQSLTKQFVVPQYTFQCSVVVTAWEAIVHIEKQSSTIQFQVWRSNHNQTGYWLVGSNTFSRKHTASDMQKEIKYVYIVQEPQVNLRVEPGDMVGVFANGLNVHYEADDDTEVYMYSADIDAPLGGLFSPLNLDPAFSMKRRGAPLIAVQIDANTAAPSHTALLPGRPIDNTMDSSSTEVINATTSFPERTLTTLKRDDMTDSVSGWARYKQLIIGVSICGTILMLLCICIIATVAIFIRARKRKRVGCETTDGQSSENKICPKLTWFSFRNHQPGSAGDLLNVGSSATCGIHMTSLLTESLSANTEQEHSYAYISSDIIHPNPKPLCRNRPPTLPPARIAVRHNPCYSSTPATSTEDLDQKSESAVADEKRVENVYDLPVFTIRPRQAREYEVPVKSLPKSTPKVVREKQHIYELTDKNEYV